MYNKLIIAVLASTLAASPALAGEYNVSTRRVQTSDLNLQFAQDRATLDRRISNAAKKVCRDGGSYGRMTQDFEWKCIDKAISEARPKVAKLVAAAGRELAVASVKRAK